MKKIYSLVAGLLLTASVWAQAPQKMSYQAVIHNSSNALVTSTPVGMQISILQGSSTGTAVYVETQTPTTNANGLVSLEIGSGTPVTGTFAGINWENGPYFIKTETDPTGGTNYSITGTSQLLSVPYALQASKSKGITPNTELLLTNTLANSSLYITPPGAGSTGGIGTSTNHGLYFFTNNVDRAVFTPNGKFGFGTLNPGSTLTVGGGDINIEDIGSGIIMKSPNGNCWRVTVDNSGAFISNPITCP